MDSLSQQTVATYANGYIGRKQIMRVVGNRECGLKLCFYAEEDFPVSRLSEAGFVFSKNLGVWAQRFRFDYRAMANTATQMVTEAFGENVPIYFEDNLSPRPSSSNTEKADNGVDSGIVGGIVGGVIGLGLGLLGLDE